jgi:hypothetical protein
VVDLGKDANVLDVAGSMQLRIMTKVIANAALWTRNP